MSEITITVRDARRSLHTTAHASRVDYLVAALSADPETIDELHAALGRFLHAEERRTFFDGWRPGTSAEPWDAGVCVIDLAARLVVLRSTYSRLVRQGGVAVKAGRGGEDVVVPYAVASDWLFTEDVDGWQARADERRRTRLATPPVDARAVLYGRVCEFIAQAYHDGCLQAPEEDADAVHRAVATVHARWLTTARADLGGLAPRDVMLARHDHVGRDLEDRAQQWSLLLACPPGLRPESAAYRYGGFGTNEIVLYYDLVRHLLHRCLEAGADAGQPAVDVARLEALRDEWLETPNFEDLHGRTPASVIARERARLPEGETGAEAMVDPDCPLCQMMADDAGVFFWGLDGCNMDDDFAFSFHATREEWEAERRKWEDFHRRFEEEQRAGKLAGTGSVWQRSYVNPDAGDEPPALRLFGVGACLAELTQDLKDAGAGQEPIDALNRAFGNLREAVQDPGGALVVPVVERMGQTLTEIADAHPALVAKCADLERQLWTFTGPTPEDEEMPF